MWDDRSRPPPLCRPPLPEGGTAVRIGIESEGRHVHIDDFGVRATADWRFGTVSVAEFVAALEAALAGDTELSRGRRQWRRDRRRGGIVHTHVSSPMQC
jgi:hypothetical protein